MEGTGAAAGDDDREDDDLDAWDGEDVPPSRPRPELPKDEQKRRYDLIHHPEHATILRRIVIKWLGDPDKNPHGLAREALDAADIEALSDPTFPSDDGEVPKYMKRLASRVVKRFQRDRKDVKLNRKSLDDQPLAVQADFEGYDGEAFADAVQRRALKQARQDPKEARALAMLIDRYVRGKTAEQIADEYKIKLATFYAITGRFKTRVQISASMIAAVAVILFVVRHPDEPSAHHDAPTVVEPSSYEKAMALTASAQKECDGAQWTACRALLDKAVAADPAVSKREMYKTLRAASDAVLGPNPNQAPAEPPYPTPEQGPDKGPDKGPKGPDKGPKGP